MFESLTDRLTNVFRNLSGRAQLTEANIQDALREVRIALLEADVNFKIVKEFVDRVREAAIGVEVMKGVTPAQQVIKVVHEELVRLHSHVEAVQEILSVGDESEGVGRKLDFIIQEMNREANTILSKSSDMEITNCAVDLKTEIEKIREQVQNIE